MNTDSLVSTPTPLTGGSEITPVSTPSSPLATAKHEAWKLRSGLRRREAMRLFVELLDKSVPGWASKAGF